MQEAKGRAKSPMGCSRWHLRRFDLFSLFRAWTGSQGRHREKSGREQGHAECVCTWYLVDGDRAKDTVRRRGEMGGGPWVPQPAEVCAVSECVAHRSRACQYLGLSVGLSVLDEPPASQSWPHPMPFTVCTCTVCTWTEMLPMG